MLGCVALLVSSHVELESYSTSHLSLIICETGFTIMSSMCRVLETDHRIASTQAIAQHKLRPKHNSC